MNNEEEQYKYLNEEKYQQTNAKVKKIALIIIGIGILCCAALVSIGFMKSKEIKEKYSEENIQSQITDLETRLASEKSTLEAKLETLEDSIKEQTEEIKKLERVQFDGFNDDYYKRKDRIAELEKEIKPVTKKIDEIERYLNDDWCFDRAETLNACLLQDEIRELRNVDPDFKIRFESSKSTPFFIFGFFLLFASLMIGGSVYFMSKRREIMAYSLQQVMPVGQEGIEKMAPTIGRAGSKMMKEMAPTIKDVAKDMAPVYGEIAKEISKGINEGKKGK